MVTVDKLNEAPTVAEFCKKIRQKEKALERHQVSAYGLKLYPNGMLRIASKTLNGKFSISEHALPDLARVPDIPAPFFMSCDRRLRSASFNWRLHKKVVPNKPVQIVLRGGTVDRILNSNLFPAPRLALIDTVSNAKPEEVSKENLRIIKYVWNGHFDLSIIEPYQNCQPRKDDIVAFGVNRAIYGDDYLATPSALAKSISILRKCLGNPSYIVTDNWVLESRTGHAYRINNNYKYLVIRHNFKKS